MVAISLFSTCKQSTQSAIKRISYTKCALENPACLKIQYYRETMIVEEPKHPLLKIKKQSGELHLSYMALAIPLIATIETIKTKMNIKMISSRFPDINLHWNGYVTDKKEQIASGVKKFC
ncbi:hypothetical protein ACJMK2_017591 [Sinanodonta woodiana]|uniref:Uncharacterized protein n=1 Tax=Sinanodonta woodiana TaxID=1069815 RepID=A0ABD3UCV5_SINWO